MKLSLFKITYSRERIFGLDLLRSIAILFVVYGHSLILLPEALRKTSSWFVLDGVSIFFVLSGFLIGGILINLINISGISFKIVKEFWLRRWFRTLPNYFLVLLILIFLNYYFSGNFNIHGVWKYFFFAQNMITIHPTHFFQEAWSLAVEEWFYLIIPVCLLVLISILGFSTRSAILIFAFFVILSVTLFRYYRYRHVILMDVSEWDLLFRMQVLPRLDSLMYGVIGAYINYYHKFFWVKYKAHLLIAGIVLFIATKFLMPYFFSYDGLYNTVFSFAFESMATLMLLPYLSNLNLHGTYLVKIISYISIASYSMYLLNQAIINWVINRISISWLTEFETLQIIIKYGLFWLLVIGLSVLLYKYFEAPMTKLRDKLTLK